jgi:hypothetical protein
MIILLNHTRILILCYCFQLHKCYILLLLLLPVTLSFRAFDFFYIFINDVCDIINHSKSFLFSDDLKNYRAIRSPIDCLLPQPDIDCVHKWCSANCIKPNFSKIMVIPFSRKMNVLNYQYRLGNSFT